MSRGRFYKDVSVEAGTGSSYRILLDGKPVKTPKAAALALPSQALAHAIAAEWRSQGEQVKPETMFLTKLANTAIDRVAPDPAAVRAQLLSMARSDVICYRAEAPAELVERQTRAWDPLLAWAQERFGAVLRTTAGLAFIEQDRSAIDSLDDELARRNAFALTALAAASALCGSVVIALALDAQRLSPDEALDTANLDKFYQAERWGWDEQERVRTTSERNELNQISRFLELLRQ